VHQASKGLTHYLFYSILFYSNNWTIIQCICIDNKVCTGSKYHSPGACILGDISTVSRKLLEVIIFNFLILNSLNFIILSLNIRVYSQTQL
jgi:hypothetical protein